MKKLAIIFLIAIAAIKGYSQSNPKTDAELKVLFDVIRNETATGGNTKTRVANAYQALADSKISVKDAVVLSGTNTYTGTVTGLTSYTAFDKWSVQFTNANSGASTVNLNSLGAIALKKNGSSALVSGDINAGQFFWLVYDGTNFQLIGGGSGGGGGTVTSVSGTTNRITSTGGATPVIDISGSYIGQSSITTLGTIGTGVWNGTAVAGGFGGTGLTSYAVGDFLYASGSTTLAKRAAVATGSVLGSAGVTTAPAYLAVSNGLIATSSTLKWGGNLTGNTTISANGFDLTISHPSQTFKITAGDGVGAGGQFLLENLDNAETVHFGLIGAAEQGGLRYGGDYSANFAARSLVDKGYVQSLTLGPFSTIDPGYTNLSGAAGSLLKGDNTWLGIGSNTFVLTSNGTTFSWAAASGGGITNAAANTEIPLSNGTNLIASTLFYASRTFTLGTAAAGATITLQAAGSATDVGFNFFNKGAGQFQFNGTGSTLANHFFNQVNSLTVNHYSTDATGVFLVLSKLRGTGGSPTTDANGDVLGNLDFQGYDGTSTINSARIKAVLNGTISTGVTPTDIVFQTTATNTVVDAMRISSLGVVSLTGNATQAGELRLYEITGSGTNFSSFKSPALAADVNYTLPPDDGNNLDHLQTDGSGVLTWIAPPGPAWLLASGGTLTGANTITGTTTNTLKYVFNSLGTTITDGAGQWLANTTAATNGAQQQSPSFTQEGQGFATGVNNSQSVKFLTYASPVQAATNPTGNLNFDLSINGAAKTTIAQLASSGVFFAAAIQRLGSNAAMRISSNISSSAIVGVSASNGGNTFSATSGTVSQFSAGASTESFAPTSGTAAFNSIIIPNIINQTGGANGQVTAINGNLTITAAVNVTGFDWNPVTPANISGTHYGVRLRTGDLLVNTGSILMGISSDAGATRSITASGSATDVGLTVTTKGAGIFTIPNSWTSGASAINVTGNSVGIGGTYLTGVSNIAVYDGTVGSTNIAGFSLASIAGDPRVNNANGVNYSIGGSIFDYFTDANNTTTVETDLYSTTTVASTLSTNGDKLYIKYIGTFNDVTATTQLKIYFGGTAIGDTGALTVSAIGGWEANATIIRTGATTVRTSVNISTPGASTALYTKETDVTGLTLSNTNIVKITGTAGGASGGSNDITSKFGAIVFFPAAP